MNNLPNYPENTVPDPNGTMSGTTQRNTQSMPGTTGRSSQMTQNQMQRNMQSIPNTNMQSMPNNANSSMQNMQSQNMQSEPMQRTRQEEIASLDNMISSKNYDGSMQQLLYNNLGVYVIIDFLIGTNNIVTREGILHSVGLSYLVLYDEKNDQYTVCDLYAVKFITYIDPQKRAVRPTMSRNVRR